MPQIKKSSETNATLIFLKWLVTVLSVVMVSGFLFLVTIIGLKIYNFNTSTQTQTMRSIQELRISQGEVEAIDINKNLLTIVVKVSDELFEVSIIDIKDGILVNQYSIKQKKSLYNDR